MIPEVSENWSRPVSEYASSPRGMLSLEHVSKQFGSVRAVSDVSLAFCSGEIHCLLGENGAGKSTLCNLIFGVHRPDAGSMTFDGVSYAPAGPADALKAGIAMVHQHFSLVSDMTVVENILLGQPGRILDRGSCSSMIRALQEEYGLAVDPQARIEDLSVSERQRVEIVKCLIRKPRLLILDEPTAVLLPDEIAKLMTVCRNVADRGCAIVLVTHKLAEIKQIADKVTVLRQGRSVAVSTEPASEIGRLVSAMIQRDLATLDVALAGSIGLDESDIAARKKPDSFAHRAEALQLDGITIRDKNGTIRVEAITLTVDCGEIVGVAGVEGNGQTEIGLMLAGLLPPSEGRFFVGGEEATWRSPGEITRMGTGIIPEDRHAVGCITSMSVAENMFLNSLDRFKRFGLMQRARLEAEAAALMTQYDVRADGPRAIFSSLSGGNQQKAVLARELTTRNLVFLLAAQPTRGLDVGAVETVYQAIRRSSDDGVGVLLISSELDELIAVADRVVVLYRGRIIGERPAHPRFREEIGSLMAGHDTTGTNA
jgi:ABC-type uncharacterized transport system ATPase subunit